MLCAISGEAPEVPVASRKSGNVFEKRLIEQYISENGTDPVNGEDLTVDDLVELKQARVVRPRPPTLTSIPALLSTFQNEWDAIVLESYQLKQQLAQTRQELSTALYHQDASERVIARLLRERDDARDALAKVSISSNGAPNGNGDAMQVDAQGLPESIVVKIEAKQQEYIDRASSPDSTNSDDRLSSTRRKRPIPDDWATTEDLQSFDAAQDSGTLYPGSQSVALDADEDLVLLGGSDGVAGIYSISKQETVRAMKSNAGAITDGLWCGTQPVIATSTGAIKIFRDGVEEAAFKQHAGAATAISLHPCGDILVSVGVDQSYILYDLQTLKPITQVFTDAELTTVSFHPDGHLLAAGDATGTIKLFEVRTGENVANFTSSTPSPIRSLSFSENGTWLASALSGSTSVSIWDLRKMAEIKTLEIGSGVKAVACDYTGQFLAVCGLGGVSVQHYSKASKSWSEVVAKGVKAVDVKWGAQAKSLVVLTDEGGVSVLRS
ncbi:hypothetical protein LTR66_010444 [Elasticomyces elasticus]|nr:hypothetical protein LTR66_010444 [Elasticomyces elasticus]